jgi:uncharacterized protein YbcC (UPF0753/DUF2309 family)
LHSILHAAHLLPTQGPITVFVHHNTLHAFEDQPFDRAVQMGADTFHCHPYLPEDHYRKKLSAGRIRVEDLEAVLLDDLGDEADRLVASFGTRYALRLAMLQFPLHSVNDAELRWLMAETDALRRFRAEVPDSIRQQMIADTRDWVLHDLRNGGQATHQIKETLSSLFREFGESSIESWRTKRWEAFTLQFLWRVCHKGLHAVAKPATRPKKMVRHRDWLLSATGEDSDQLVHELLIRLSAAFLDQGFAGWILPDADQGFFEAFVRLYAQPLSTPARWMRGLATELRQLQRRHFSAEQSIEESLRLLGVEPAERDEFIAQTLVALRGWAGMFWQLETNAPWTPRPAPPGSLIDFLAVRLLLDRFAAAAVARDTLGYTGPLDQLRAAARRQAGKQHGPSIDQRAYTVFQLAQVRRWRPKDLCNLSQEQWQTLVDEIEAFSSVERRRVYHLAYERKYRNETLDAVINHSRRVALAGRGVSSRDGARLPAYQVVCCLDEREESFRRALEEVDPECETFGIAGFFGVAMYYRGITDAHYKPLCPVNIKPQHFVQEQPVYSHRALSRRQAEGRRRIGQVLHQVHMGTRGIVGGVLTGLFGSLAAIPLLARVLWPRTTAQLCRAFGRIAPPPMTELHLERTEDQVDVGGHRLGYTVEEMTSIVEAGLRAMGLVGRMSPLIVICGHGSASLNNPHEAAHDCGACGGARGGPNARAFAQMANDLRVRQQLAARNLRIPDRTAFVGAYHNTCDDSVTWFDLDRLPVAHRKLFERARNALDEARQRSAHERCRRFESAELTLSTAGALRHVEGRAEDLSQTRPEYGHATNALCFVGRREWSRGLFLDHRAFLTSYDPTQDDANSSILIKLLQAVIPVCAGISLEYYFSFIDPTGFGCGTKLPHNITSLLGVMDGAASDLRTGLPWQMVEIHEPVRLLFVIETTPQAMQQILTAHADMARLVNGNWVQLATLDARTSTVHIYRDGQFARYYPESSELPTVASSLEWYRGSRDPLGFASIGMPHPSSKSNEGTSRARAEAQSRG